MEKTEINLKNRCLYLVESYLKSKCCVYSIDYSDTGSVYFDVTLGYNCTFKIRISDHQPKNYCCQVSIRYDKWRGNDFLKHKKLIKRTLDKSIDKCERKYIASI